MSYIPFEEISTQIQKSKEAPSPDWSRAPENAVWAKYFTEDEMWFCSTNAYESESDGWIKRPSKGAPKAKVEPNKYTRTIIGLCGTPVEVDVYRVQQAFPTDLPPLEHLQKKALCAGLRGHKSRRQDILDIIESAEAALLMHDQMEKINA